MRTVVVLLSLPLPPVVDVSDVSDVSEVSDVSDVSDVSEVSEPSDVPDAVDESAVVVVVELLSPPILNFICFLKSAHLSSISQGVLLKRERY